MISGKKQISCYNSYLKHRHKHRLSYRLLLLILLCSSFFTVLGTGLQLYMDYRSDLNSIEESFRQIELSFVTPVTVSLWNFNHKQVQVQINGMLSMPDMHYIDVREKRGQDFVSVAAVGSKPDTAMITREFPLEFTQGTRHFLIGSMLVTANPNNICYRLREKVLLIFYTQTIKTFFVSFIILFIFYHCIIRHLNAIANHLVQVRPDHLIPPLRLQRSAIFSQKPDALEKVVCSLNQMKQNLAEFMKARGESERQIQSLQQYLANIIDSMPAILIVVDDSCHVTRWNRMAEEYTGISASEAYGKALPDFFPNLAEENLKVRQVIATKQPIKREKIAWLKNNQQRFLSLLIYPLHAAEPQEAVLMIEDVTEQVKLEELMIQAEKMMSVGGLAAGMAHEINNPLGGILQGTQIVIRRLSGELRDNRTVAQKHGLDFDKLSAYLQERKIFDYLRNIHSAGERASRIISNMMKFSRPGATEKVPVDLSRLLENVIELASNDFSLKKQYDFKHIAIRKEFHHRERVLYCSETEIEQVIFNLLKNAAQALSRVPELPDPEIVIRTGDEPTMVRIEVEDNGPGIEATIIRRVFEPFFTTKPVGEGTGLGLAVSYMIVTQIHQGIMTVESSPGKGACFIIRLPVSA